jgi:acyl transferase domain-containing protein
METLKWYVAINFIFMLLREQLLISFQAVVSGVNVMEDPCSSVMLGALGMLSPEGKCYSFDHRANGYGRGEGVGTVIIKPLSAAIRDRNTIRAVIRATGSNQDGRTPGVTLPSQDAQERLIRKVYSDAGLDRSATRYVEAHGTGTFAGDPVEARAIAGAFESSKNQQPLYIGSIKANVGHLEAAAGIAGLIKAVMVVENGIIPPAANFEAVNPKIPLDEWNIRIATAPITLPHGDVRRVSVNSFGFGGTNAHAVVDDVWSVLLERSMQSVYADSKLHHQTLLGAFHGKWNLNGSDGLLSGLSTPDSTTPLSSAATNLHNGVDTHAGANGVNGVNKFVSRTEAINNSSANTKVFILSAFDETGIQRSAISLSEHLKSLSAVDSKPSSGHSYMGDLAYTLSAKRNMFPWKSFCLASSEVALIENLQKNVSKPVRTGNAEPRIGFIFTGQGAQWPAMGKALASYPIFNRSINDAAEYMVSLGSPWNLNGVSENL